MPGSREMAEFRLGFAESLRVGFGKKMMVNQAGRCEVLLETNAFRLEVAEIGRYVVYLDVAEAQDLRNRVRKLVGEPLPPSGPLLPGAPMVNVYLEENGQTLTKSFYLYTASPTWQELRPRLSALEDRALQALQTGLRAELALSAGSVNRGGRIGVSVRLVALGAQAISFYRPLAESDTSGGTVMLMGVRSDIPEKDLSIVDYESSELAADQLESPLPGGAGEDKALLQLRRTTGLALRFETALDWPPGKYDVRLNLMTNGLPPEDDQALFIRGQIMTLPVPLTITP